MISAPDSDQFFSIQATVNFTIYRVFIYENLDGVSKEKQEEIVKELTDITGTWPVKVEETYKQINRTIPKITFS